MRLFHKGGLKMTDMKPGDLKFEAYPAPVLTGMQTGKMTPGVKVTHITSGISVVCDEFRHQLKNREKALIELQKLV